MKKLSIFLSCLYCVFLLSFFMPARAQVTITGGSYYPAGNPMSGIAYGNSVYVAVGYYGTIAKSTDGINWAVTQNSSFINTTYKAITFGNGIFVATSADGKIITSSNGNSWTQQVSGTVNSLNEIAYANSKFIAVGNSNTVLSSTDGVTWTSMNIGAASGDYLLSIIYAQGKFVIGGRDAATGSCQAYYSTTGDAASWTRVSFGSFANLNRISYLNNKFFAFCINTNIYTSTDAVTWTAVTNSRLTTPNQIFHGLYDGTTYFLFGTSSENNSGSVFTSTDGTNFSLQAQATTLTIQGVALLNGRYFMVGNEGLVSSNDGINWRFPAGLYNSVATDGTRYVAVGQNTGSEAAIYTSTDFSNWTGIPAYVKPLNGITYGGGKFVAVGSVNGSYSTYAYSADGLSWTTGSTGIADLLRSVTYGNSKYVAVGANGRIVYSSNGTSWTSADNGTGYQYYGVAYLNNYFIAVGGSTSINGTAKVKYSADGISWTDVSPSPAIVGHFHSIAYDGSKYVLVGRDNTSGSLKFFSVTSSNITSASAYSSTSTVTTPEGNVGTLGYGGVAYANSRFIAIANLAASPNSAYILSSPDGSNWTATAAGVNGRLRGLITTGSTFKAVGTLDTRLSIAAAATLPVHLLNFSGHKDNTTNELNWITVNEENTARFELERSKDGRTFTTLATVTAINEPGQHIYQSHDANAGTSVYYYRLKMIDLDGKFIYSQVIRIDGSAEKKSISIYPNPAAGYFTLGVLQNRPAEIRIFNNRGEKMFQQTVSGNNSLINIQSLTPGTYIIRVDQDGKTYTDKLVHK